MLRPIFVSLVSVSLAIAGCTSKNASDKKTDGSTPTAATPTKPKSKPNSATPLQTQDLAAAETLVIEVDSSAKIGGVVRSIFQDTHGVLWVGGEGDLFRNDGKALTSYDIKDDQGKGVTIIDSNSIQRRFSLCRKPPQLTKPVGLSRTKEADV